MSDKDIIINTILYCENQAISAHHAECYDAVKAYSDVEAFIQKLLEKQRNK